MNINRLLTLLGCISLSLALLALLAIPLGMRPLDRPLDGYLFMLGLMTLVSSAVIIAARLRAQQNPLAVKVIPSSLVSYLLFILIALRWLDT